MECLGDVYRFEADPNPFGYFILLIEFTALHPHCHYTTLVQPLSLNHFISRKSHIISENADISGDNRVQPKFNPVALCHNTICRALHKCKTQGHNHPYSTEYSVIICHKILRAGLVTLHFSSVLEILQKQFSVHIEEGSLAQLHEALCQKFSPILLHVRQTIHTVPSMLQNFFSQSLGQHWMRTYPCSHN